MVVWLNMVILIFNLIYFYSCPIVVTGHVFKRHKKNTFFFLLLLLYLEQKKSEDLYHIVLIVWEKMFKSKTDSG